MVISSQPITCEVIANSTSQPSAGHAGPSRKSRSAKPSTAAPNVAPTVASNNGAATGARPAPGTGSTAPYSAVLVLTPPPAVAWRSIRMYTAYSTPTPTP